MKYLISLALALLCGSAFGQTNTVPITNAPPGITFGQDILTFLSSGSNFMVTPYGIVSSSTGSAHRDFGFGSALAYKVNDFIAPAIRLDYLNHQFYQGALTAELQYPLHLGQNLTLIPFGLVGGATPFGGAGDKNITLQGVAGLGLALQLNFLGSIGQHLDLIGDFEKWSAIDGNQYRVGLLWKF